LGTGELILRQIVNCPFRLQTTISTKRGLDVEMVMEYALEDPNYSIKLIAISGFP
jgi:hypothetical protein